MDDVTASGPGGAPGWNPDPAAAPMQKDWNGDAGFAPPPPPQAPYEQPPQAAFGQPQPQFAQPPAQYGQVPQYGQQPQYGQPQYGFGPGQPGPSVFATNAMALYSLVMGIAGVLLDFLCGVGIALAIPGVIVGFLAYQKSQRLGGVGRGMAIAGMCIGGFAVILSVVGYLVIGGLMLGG